MLLAERWNKSAEERLSCGVLFGDALAHARAIPEDGVMLFNCALAHLALNTSDQVYAANSEQTFQEVQERILAIWESVPSLAALVVPPMDLRTFFGISKQREDANIDALNIALFSTSTRWIQEDPKALLTRSTTSPPEIARAPEYDVAMKETTPPAPALEAVMAIVKDALAAVSGLAYRFRYLYQAGALFLEVDQSPKNLAAFLSVAAATVLNHPLPALDYVDYLLASGLYPQRRDPRRRVQMVVARSLSSSSSPLSNYEALRRTWDPVTDEQVLVEIKRQAAVLFSLLNAQSSARDLAFLLKAIAERLDPPEGYALVQERSMRDLLSTLLPEELEPYLELAIFVIGGGHVRICENARTACQDAFASIKRSSISEEKLFAEVDIGSGDSSAPPSPLAQVAQPISTQRKSPFLSAYFTEFLPERKRPRTTSGRKSHARSGRGLSGISITPEALAQAAPFSKKESEFDSRNIQWIRHTHAGSPFYISHSTAPVNVFDRTTNSSQKPNTVGFVRTISIALFGSIPKTALPLPPEYLTGVGMSTWYSIDTTINPFRSWFSKETLIFAQYLRALSLTTGGPMSKQVIPPNLLPPDLVTSDEDLNFAREILGARSLQKKGYDMLGLAGSAREYLAATQRFSYWQGDSRVFQISFWAEHSFQLVHTGAHTTHYPEPVAKDSYPIDSTEVPVTILVDLQVMPVSSTAPLGFQQTRESLARASSGKKSDVIVYTQIGYTAAGDFYVRFVRNEESNVRTSPGNGFAFEAWLPQSIPHFAQFINDKTHKIQSSIPAVDPGDTESFTREFIWISAFRAYVAQRYHHGSVDYYEVCIKARFGERVESTPSPLPTEPPPPLVGLEEFESTNYLLESLPPALLDAFDSGAIEWPFDSILETTKARRPKLFSRAATASYYYNVERHAQISLRLNTNAPAQPFKFSAPLVTYRIAHALLSLISRESRAIDTLRSHVSAMLADGSSRVFFQEACIASRSFLENELDFTHLFSTELLATEMVSEQTLGTLLEIVARELETVVDSSRVAVWQLSLLHATESTENYHKLAATKDLSEFAAEIMGTREEHALALGVALFTELKARDSLQLVPDVLRRHFFVPRIWKNGRWVNKTIMEESFGWLSGTRAMFPDSPPNYPVSGVLGFHAGHF